MNIYDLITMFPTATTGSFILDTVTALNGYSLRKLKASATKAIRVRRSSDNAEQDIGFVGEDLDESALTTFVGANDGFVTTWYNQVDNGATENIIQTAQATQPKIVSSGVVVKRNGKASVDMLDSKQMQLSLLASKVQPFTLSFVVDTTNMGAIQRLYSGGIQAQLFSGDFKAYSGSFVTASGAVVNTLYNPHMVFNYPNGKVHYGSTVVTGTYTANSTMNSGALYQTAKGAMSEFIITADTDVNATLKANQETYYSI